MVELFYPRLCAVCRNSLVEGEHYICTNCLIDFPFSDRDYALGERVLDSFAGYIRPEEIHSLFYYNKYSDYRHLIYAIKYHSKKKLGVHLGRMLGIHMEDVSQIDYIIPVPLHPRREKKRGFNQAFQIALGISEILGVEILDDVIIRTGDNVSQTGKSAEERRMNVENIFELRNPQKIQGCHILLVDDVITTGATIGSCLYALSAVENVRFSLACLALVEM